MYTLSQLIGWTATGIVFGIILGFGLVYFMACAKDNAEEKEIEDKKRAMREGGIVKDFYKN